MEHLVLNKWCKDVTKRVYVPIYTKKFLCKNCNKIFIQENFGCDTFYHLTNNKWVSRSRITGKAGKVHTLIEGKYVIKIFYVVCPVCNRSDNIQGKIDEFTPLDKYGQVKLFNGKLLKLKT